MKSSVLKHVHFLPIKYYAHDFNWLRSTLQCITGSWSSYSRPRRLSPTRSSVQTVAGRAIWARTASSSGRETRTAICCSRRVRQTRPRWTVRYVCTWGSIYTWEADLSLAYFGQQIPWHMATSLKIELTLKLHVNLILNTLRDLCLYLYIVSI